MFNEIVELADTSAEMAHKAKLLSLSSARPAAGARGLERTESHQALAGIGLTPSSAKSFKNTPLGMERPQLKVREDSNKVRLF